MPNILPSALPLLSLTSQIRAALPLQGLTLLAVEDSRFTSDALRLMCQRAGARLRRAETLKAADTHLRTYRPDMVIVDLGLPDGKGETLIRSLVMSRRRPTVVLGTSGNPMGKAAALSAGADGFLEKPYESQAAFCKMLLQHLPDMHDAPTSDTSDGVCPDPLTLQEDLRRAATLLETSDVEMRRYVTSFVAGIACQIHDSVLASTAIAAGQGKPVELANLRRLIACRLSAQSGAFSSTGASISQC